MARVGMTRGGYGLSLPRSEKLPVLACEPATFVNTHAGELKYWGLSRVEKDYNMTVAQLEEKAEEEQAAAIKTYNPMGDRYTPPPDQDSSAPFGHIDGFRTNLGPISFPKGPVKGYIFDKDHSWVLFATSPGQRRRGARGSRGRR